MNWICWNIPGISEAKMIACLNYFGSDVDIVVRKTHQDFSKGQTQVSFARNFALC
jgi:hypothetical protein